MDTKNWWAPLTFILIISPLGVRMIGFQTYNDAKPMSGFKDKVGHDIITQKDIENGQEVFHKYALMEYGSFFSDGAQRGPDFTAEALHQMTLSMQEFYQKEASEIESRVLDEYDQPRINDIVQKEFKKNTFDENDKKVLLSDAYIVSARKLFNILNYRTLYQYITLNLFSFHLVS